MFLLLTLNMYFMTGNEGIIDDSNVIHTECLNFCFLRFNTLSANPTKWSNLPTHCLNVFDHFVGLALKGLIKDDLKSRKNGTNIE